jgi:hypothetical protein
MLRASLQRLAVQVAAIATPVRPHADALHAALLRH